MKNTSAPRAPRALHVLHVPQIDEDDDTLTAAIKYAKAGWYVLPVNPSDKSPVVGKRWQSKSSRNVDVLTAWFAGTGHGIALHVGRSGATFFDVDKPHALPELLRRALKTTPPPFQSSRPDVPGRGHYPYLTPKGRTLGNGGGKLGGEWGQVRGTNGLIIVAPTPHIDGGKYVWQTTGRVPAMPDELADALPEGSPAEDAASNDTVEAFIAEHSESTRPELLTAWVVILRRHFGNGSSRHDSTVSVMAGAMKEARAGYFSAQAAIDILRPMFLAEVTKPPSSSHQGEPRTGAKARSEWRSIVAWAVGQALGADLDVVRARVAQKMPQQVVVIDPDADDSDESRDDARGLDVTGLEGGFWESRESLRTIYIAALARMASPWAVLGCCAAKALALVPPTVTLPPLVGGPGSLNWFCTLAARSGGGKGAAMAVSDELLKPEVYVRNIGSGEGMIDAYRRPADKETGEPAGLRESVMFEADEIDTLAAYKQRGGSTTFITLRSAFSGVALGSSTKASGGFHLAKHSYRMTLVVGAQPARTGILFDETTSGTPQRFMWFPATDKRVSVDRPVWPGQLDVTTEATSKVLRYGAQLTVPADAERLIVTTRALVNNGEASPLDTHRLFVREKFAYALAILDGRDNMRLDDWELAGVAMEVSDYTRSWVAGQREADAVDEAVKHGRVSGIKLAAANEERDYRETQRRNRIARRIIERLTASGDQGMTNREIGQLFDKRSRGIAAVVLKQLVADGVVVKCERRKGDRSDTVRYALADDEF